MRRRQSGRVCRLAITEGTVRVARGNNVVPQKKSSAKDKV